jgi:chondroitin AC lyase
MVFFAVPSFIISGHGQDLETVRQRVVAELMKPVADDSLVEDLVETISQAGSWADINYLDVSRTAFDHQRHLGNMVAMSRAFKDESSSHFLDSKVKKALLSALEFWCRNDFICDNWWWNQVGTPNQLVSIMLIMDDTIPGDLVLNAQPIIGRAHINAWGARPGGDRIKIAVIEAKNMLFMRDRAGFEELIGIIGGEIKFATGRGMQHDYSFHHRIDRVNNTLSYGLGYAGNYAEWAVYVSGTEYAIPEEKTRQLIDFYLDGLCKMMIYGSIPDPGAKNRSISRKNTLHPETAKIPAKLLSVSDYRKDELEEIVEIRSNQAEAESSFSTFFWHSDHFSFQRPGFFTSVRMYSSRNHNMEAPYNSEGLLNHHRGDGANHISRSGSEYKEVWPVYDWQKIPGTTVLQKPLLPPPEEIQKKGLTDFAGAVTDGMYGAVAFEFISPHDPVEARKSWFFFDEEYVCLGAGINNHSDMPVVTTLNQCLLSGSVTVHQNGQTRVIELGDHELDDAEWISHDGITYLFPEPAKVRMSNRTESGSWWDITHQMGTPENKTTRDLFTLWIDHGPGAMDANYQYFVIPSPDGEEIQKGRKLPGIQVLSNTPDIQAVRHSGLGISQVVFYRSGEIRISEQITLGCISPGVIMLKTGEKGIREISVSDPSQQLRRMLLTVNLPVNESGENYSAAWDEGNRISEISFDLPRGPHAGKSVTLDLSRQ